MSLENLTTTSHYYTEKVVGPIYTRTVTITNPSGTNTMSQDWQIATASPGAGWQYDEPFSDIPLLRTAWSSDGGVTWYDSGTQIPYSYTLNFPGGSTPSVGLDSGLTIGTNRNEVWYVGATGIHGNVTVNSSGQATWTGGSRTFDVRYAALMPSNSLNIDSIHTIPANKVMASGSETVSGTINSVLIFKKTIPISYSPNFFSIEFNIPQAADINGSGIDLSTKWTHSIVYYTIPGTPPATVFIAGGISGNNLVLTAMISNGGGTSSTSFTLNYRIIDLGVNQTIDGSNISNYSLINTVNSPSRQSPVVITANATGSLTTSELSKEFSGLPFVDHYYDCSGLGYYFRNSYAQDRQQFASIFGLAFTPSAVVYGDNTSLSSTWTPGFDGTNFYSPSGRGFRYVVYGDYSEDN